jgi:D-3-phosphoglycerate dehydrogenase / 2-oxoglutarate reductase
MKIVVADSLASSALDRLRETGWTVDARSGRSPAALAADLADADALIVRSATRVDRALLAAAPRLRVVARAGSGVDNVDVETATARGIVVMNAPGANSVSVAELAFALILALARRIPAADASMKSSHWDKSKFTGGELRSKVLGIVGLGRVGQEVASRAHAFGMEVVAHDPFISSQVASDLGVELVGLDELCRRADHITLHVPSTAATRRLFNAQRFAQCKKGVRLVNTARGDLIDEAALVAAIESGQVGGAALDVFDREPPADWRLASMPQVIATPHIAASTREALELVSVDTANAVRDFLRDGVIRNAVNFPSVSLEEYNRLRPYLLLAERLGSVAAQMGEARTEAVGVRYYGGLASEDNTQVLGAAVLVGLLRAMLSSGVTPVNARAVASRRGIEMVESRSSRPRNFTSLISVKLQTSSGERWVEGTAFENGSLRLVLVNGVAVEAPLEGTVLIIANRDQPGVIGDVGSLLGRHRVNIANFALGRSSEGAVGVVNVDEVADGGAGGVVDEAVLAEIRAVPAVRAAWVIRL